MCLKGSNFALEGGATLEIRNKPRNPKMKVILEITCKGRWDEAMTN
jgi:hypothetical protein